MNTVRRFVMNSVVALSITSPLVVAEELQRPNIVVIMTDDSGYSDIGAYGGEIATPNIDELAERGLRFQRFYTNAKCSPTRASLLTGQYPQNVGVGELARPQDETPFSGYLGFLSRKNNVTIAEVLRNDGYRTIMSGKWHLGGEREVDGQPAIGENIKWPLARGFEKAFFLLHGAADYYSPRAPRLFRLGNEVYEPHPDEEFYATDAITDFAIQFVKEVSQESDAPFFLYVPYTAPHTPRQAPAELVDKYSRVYASNWNAIQKRRYEKLKETGLIPPQWGPPKPIEDSLNISKEISLNMALHAAMLEKVDENVGRLLQALREVGEYENTLVIYLSDNGAEWPIQGLSNTPFRGEKASLSEGGLLTHFILHWPHGIRNAGEIIKEPAHVIDVMPTLLEIAGVDYPENYQDRELTPVDGNSFADVFQEGRWEGHDILFWDLYGQHAVVAYPWKYSRDARGNYHLYNLELDGTEIHDLVSRYPEKMWELASAHASWAMRNQVMPYEVVRSAQRHLDIGHNETSWADDLIVKICDRLVDNLKKMVCTSD